MLKTPLADVIEQVFLASDIVIEATLSNPEGATDLPDRSRSIPLVIEKGGGHPVKLGFPSSISLSHVVLLPLGSGPLQALFPPLPNER